MEAIERSFETASSKVGLPVDQLKYVFMLLLCYPVAVLFRYIPNNTPQGVRMRHLFSIVFSVLGAAFSLGTYSWIHSFVSSTIVYLIVKFSPKGKSHLPAFLFAMGYMSASHIYRLYTDYMGWTLDFTGPQMVITLKLTSFAFNYDDGQSEKSPEEFKKKSIKTMPSLLEFYGFVYFFPTFFAGPAIEIRDYLTFVDGHMFNDDYCKGKAPNTVIPTLTKLTLAILFAPLVILSGNFPVRWLVSDAFAALPIWERLWWVYPTAGLVRFKYYFGWFLAEGSCLAVGIGYNGFSRKGSTLVPLWDRATNVYPLKVEFAANMRECIGSWNVYTANWLKNYVYLRISPPGTKPSFQTTLATYSMSAFWHGFYPGYYIAFPYCALHTEAAKDIRRYVRPYFVTKNDEPIQPRKAVYDFVSVVLTAYIMTYGGIFFLLLDLHDCLEFARLTWYSCVLLPIFPLIYFRFIKPSQSPQQRRPASGGAAATAPKKAE